MQARIVAPLQGVRWLGEGWRLFRAAPLAWLVIVFGYYLLVSIVSVLPFVGFAAALISVPAFSVSLMAAARAAAREAPVHPALLFEGFRHRLAWQLLLGVVYLACIWGVGAVTALATDLTALRSLLSGEERIDEAGEMQALLRPVGLALLLYTPVMMSFWFAPLLTAWHSMAPAKALFFSFVACLINWRAFLAYGAALVLAIVALSLLTRVALGLFSSGAAASDPALIAGPLAILFMPTLYASFYASYRDVFGGEPV